VSDASEDNRIKEDWRIAFLLKKAKKSDDTIAFSSIIWYNEKRIFVRICKDVKDAPLPSGKGMNYGNGS
jgi:hypothetical protein